MSLKIGEQVPDFELEANSGEKIRLSDYKGKNVVLYFYPKDMTPGCTTEACDFRDRHTDFTSLNTVVLGISPDPIARHQKFIQKHELPFPLLSDETHEVSESYDVWKLKKNFGKEYMGIERSTFLIGKEGELLKEWRKVKVAGHAEEIQKELEQVEA